MKRHAIFSCLLLVSVFSTASVPLANAGTKSIASLHDRVFTYLRKPAPKRLIRTAEHARPFVEMELVGSNLHADDIRQGVARALTKKIPRICVNGNMVSTAVAHLRQLSAAKKNRLKIAAVVNYPHAMDGADVVEFAAHRALEEGAHEVEAPVYLGHLKSVNPDFGALRHYMSTLATAVKKHGRDRTSTIILEPNELDDKQIERLTQDAMGVGINFIRMSMATIDTGSSHNFDTGMGGETIERTAKYVALVSGIVGAKGGVKASTTAFNIWDFLLLWVARGGDNVVGKNARRFRLGARDIRFAPPSLHSSEPSSTLTAEHYTDFLEEPALYETLIASGQTIGRRKPR